MGLSVWLYAIVPCILGNNINKKPRHNLTLFSVRGFMYVRLEWECAKLYLYPKFETERVMTLIFDGEVALSFSF